MYPNADLNTQEKMTISKSPISEEVANRSDQGKSPETLAKTKDGSTFAAKARAAELNATRARKAVAKHALLLTDDHDDAVNGVPPLPPVPLESSKLTRSRSRASNACKPPNNLTEFPEVTAENKLKSPSPQHHSLQLSQRLQRPSLSHQYSNKSPSCLDPPQIPVIEYPGVGKASLSTEKPSVADWQTKVILNSSPHDHHQPLKQALDHTQPILQGPIQGLHPSVSIEQPSVVDWQTEVILKPPPHEHHQPLKNALDLTQPILQQPTKGLNPFLPTEKPFVEDWQTKVILDPSPHDHHKSLKHVLGRSQPSLRRPNQELHPSHVPPPPSTHPDGTSASADRQSVSNWSSQRTIAPIPCRGLPQASPTINNPQPPDSTRPSTHIDEISASANKQSVLGWSFEPTIAHRRLRSHVPTPPSTHLDGTSASPDRRSVADRESLADWPFEPTIAPIPRPSLRQASPPIENFQPPGPPLEAHNIDHKAFNPNSPYSWDPEMHTIDDMSGGPRSQYTGQDLRWGASIYQGAKPSAVYSQLTAAISSSLDPNLPPGSSMNPHVAQRILNSLGRLSYNELLALSNKEKLQINTAQSTLGQPQTDWNPLSTYKMGADNTAKTTPTHLSMRDPNAYTNPVHVQKPNDLNQSRTVAHDPLARPITTQAPSITMRSSLKPEAAIYTPQSIGTKDPQPSNHATGGRIAAEGAGNIAMANFVKQRKRQTLEEAVESFRKNPMDKDFEAVKKSIEYRTDNMTAYLAGVSLPDTEISRKSVAVCLPNPIGHGRPNTTTTAPTIAAIELDKRVGSDIIANTIANLKDHENPAPGDHSIRYRNAHACEVDQGPEGNKSLFDPAWGTPPSRVARDPRRIRQGGSGGVSGAFGRR